MHAVPDRESKAEKEIGRGLVSLPPVFCRSGTILTVQKIRPTKGADRGILFLADRRGWGKEGIVMAKERSEKERFIEVYSQGLTNVEKIIVDTETGVNYVLASSSLTVGCGMSVLVDADGKPIVTPVD